MTQATAAIVVFIEFPPVRPVSRSLARAA